MDIAASSATAVAAQGPCSDGNDFDGRIGVRISALFVILIGSLCGKGTDYWCGYALLTVETGAAFPVYAYRHKGIGVPKWAFFVAKYFGSGVIIATAFIHVRTNPADEVSRPDSEAYSASFILIRLHGS